ncbi:sulfurtransferase [Clostridium sp. CCUG 7971]|uniref:sulfurtransferase n=1 Tax=Clostridium sp. CCUG 7971 TaxID=2811414 RepID=UPI001ABA9659|nr:sulfurtransferase [Clostridium sp. CCUG 7971]MBO3443303.1 sulfurtransferase [Clostridium sp. CCUG 7971]
MKNIVNASWLKDNLDNEKLVIVDCRFNLMDKDYGRKSYEEGHIKKAVRIDLETQLSSEVKEFGGRHPLPTIDELKETFESIGISNDSIVIAYDEGDLAGPSRLWWILKYMGHKNVYILDGGINSFKELNGEIVTDVTRVVRGNFDILINENMIVDMSYVKEKLYNKNVAIVDSRENIRYIGEWEPVDKKAGHIPGALNYFWLDILDKGENSIKIKSKEDLSVLFEKLNDYDEVIVYCGSGITACPNSLALTEIGIKHKVYPGSFSDWISYDDNKVDTK